MTLLDTNPLRPPSFNLSVRGQATMASIISPPLSIKFPYTLRDFVASSGSEATKSNSSEARRRRPISFAFIGKFGTSLHRSSDIYKLNSSSVMRVIVKVNGNGAVDASEKEPAASDSREVRSSTFDDSSVALFVQKLGLDNDPLDREQAIVVLWKYSLGGKECIDSIMQFHGCVNLLVNLLRSEAGATCEAAAGLLRSISSISVYRNTVAESGAMEELLGLLCRPSLASEVKEQSMSALWNLSADDNLRGKIATADNLQLLVKSLDGEDLKVKEAAGGVLANLALSHGYHNLMVEAGVIPKLASLIKYTERGYRVIQEEAKNALLELAKDECYKILILEEGLVPVPLVSGSAYKTDPVIGQFLRYLGVKESDDGQKPQSGQQSDKLFNLVHWESATDQLVVILGLDDELAISRAVESIADSSINEHLKLSFKKTGVIPRLIRLLDHSSDAVKLAVACALERLSVSPALCEDMETNGAIHSLIGILKQARLSETLMEKTLDVLARILEPSKEMRSAFHDRPGNGPKSFYDLMRDQGPPGPKPVLTASSRREVLDSAFIARLIEILKASSLHLQRKAASILEFLVIADPSVEIMTSLDIASALESAFQQKAPVEVGDFERQELEKHALQLEEVGLMISSASRLLTRLLESEQFSQTINSDIFSKSLREILKFDVPFDHKDWIAAGLVKLSSVSSTNWDFQNPINSKVTVSDTIPRLIEQLKSSCSPEVQEAAAVELNRILAEGVVDWTRAVVAEGGISPLVRLLDEGCGRAAEAAVAILHILSMDRENHPVILAAGAEPVLRRIVVAGRPQWTRAVRTLRNLPT